MSEKNQQPTEKKRRDSRKEGQVIKSVEIISGLQLVAIWLFFHFFAETLLERSAALMIFPIQMINQPFIYALEMVSEALIKQSLLMLAVLCGLTAALTVLSILLQIGLLLATKAVGVKGKHINPLNNLKQIFSINSIIELIKSTLKVIVLSLIFSGLFIYYAHSFEMLPYADVHIALPLFSHFMSQIWLCLIIFYVVIAVADYAWQHSRVMKQLRMSREEIIQEYKNQEGDPHIKHRRRELQREIQGGSLAQNVKRSTVVVRNPTHIAVCLAYHPQDIPIPRVLEKGAAGQAAQIVMLAQQVAVPVVENIPLARTLFHDVACGETIPDSLFEPVAALLRMVMDIDYAPSG